MKTYTTISVRLPTDLVKRLKELIPEDKINEFIVEVIERKISMIEHERAAIRQQI